jgi:hypothetical protein
LVTVNRLDALLLHREIAAVLALGGAADEAWQMWKKAHAGAGVHGGLRSGDAPDAAREFLEG